MVVAAAEVLFEPHVETDEEISTAHLFNFQFRRSDPTVAPGDRNGGPRITPHDCLERNLDRDVEMWSDEGWQPSMTSLR